jgi:hypothetical protein
VSDEEALEKISNAFRSQRKTARKKEEEARLFAGESPPRY